MPSSLSHAIAGLTVGVVLRPVSPTRRFWWAAGLCAVLPDLDAIGRPFGSVGLESIAGGHRGFTHSMVFALAFGAVVAWSFFRGNEWDETRGRLWLCFALATATHGVLDALNTKGEGVKFLSPFSDDRFTFPWQPIDPYATPAGANVLVRLFANELLWVALPCALLVGVLTLVRRARARDRV